MDTENTNPRESVCETMADAVAALSQETKKNKLIFFTLTEYINNYLSISLEKRFTNQINL